MPEEGQHGCLKMKIIEYHDYKTLLGPCFISFSIPLFVPGVVLTVVGSYGNQSSFPTFGAWHIVGIVILSFAVLMLLTGILLKCFYRPVISAEIEKHLTPTSSMVTGSKNLGFENEIYSSSNAKMNNKVSHHDLNESHRVVSIHEAKTTNTAKSKNNQPSANGALGGDRKNRDLNQRQEARQPSSTLATSTVASESKPKVPPPSYEDLDFKSKRNMNLVPKEIPEHHFTTSATRAMQGQVKVTANIVAEAETTLASGSRDLSSDGGTEQTTFLPEKKRKKKKRRKRHSNLSNQSHQSTDDTDGALGDTSARQVLPELRVRPVLIHDGEEHHHHDLHVHFQDETAKVTITEDNGDKSPLEHPEERSVQDGI